MIRLLLPQLSGECVKVVRLLINQISVMFRHVNAMFPQETLMCSKATNVNFINIIIIQASMGALRVGEESDPQAFGWTTYFGKWWSAANFQTFKTI